MVVANYRGAILDLIGGEIGFGDEASPFSHCGGDGAGDIAVVEVAGAGREAAEGGGEDGLLEGVALLVEVAVALKDVGRLGETGEAFGAEIAGLFSGEDVAASGETDGWCHVLGEGEPAEVLLGVDESGDSSGDAGGLVADEGHIGDDVALGVEVHVTRGGGGSFFAVVDEMVFKCVTVAVTDQHEAATAEISGLRVDDGKGKADGDCGVHGVAAPLEDLDAGIGGVVLDGDDHGVAGANGCETGLLGEGEG